MYVYLFGECDDPTRGAFGLCFFSVTPSASPIPVNRDTM